MYVPDHFLPPDDEAMFALIKDQAFGALITPDLQVTHIPFQLEARAGGPVLVGHVARANLHWQVFDGCQQAVVIFQGPHGYISPGWGAAAESCETLVPTWNYAVVHAKGCPRVIEGEQAARDLLTQMTRVHETGRPTPWVVDDLAPGLMERLLRALVVFEMPVVALEGKWKLSQNRSVADRAAFVRMLQDEGRDDLAQVMAD